MPLAALRQKWRPMRANDLEAIMSIAENLHPDYPERLDIFADKLAFCPLGCQVVEDGGTLLGYGFAHGWSLGLPPLLDTPLGYPPGPIDCLHLHDIALMAQIRGLGLVDLYLDHLRPLAQSLGVAALSLIAVAGKDGYWRGKGFGDFSPPNAALRQRLASYGNAAVYLSRQF